MDLRLKARLCEPHQCHCGAMVNSDGTHGLACRQSASKTTRHHKLNDLVWLALGCTNVLKIKEQVGLVRSDGKRMDGLLEITRQTGKSAFDPGRHS